MWKCENCDWTGEFPSWDQWEVERLQRFIGIPYCPECGSYQVREELPPDPIYGEMGYFDDTYTGEGAR